MRLVRNNTNENNLILKHYLENNELKKNEMITVY